jgi:hypothetical protein
MKLRRRRYQFAGRESLILRERKKERKKEREREREREGRRKREKDTSFLQYYIKSSEILYKRNIDNTIIKNKNHIANYVYWRNCNKPKMKNLAIDMESRQDENTIKYIYISI